MTRQFRIIHAGPHATVQDRGRAGYQSLGVPEGGALDQDAMRLGNKLVGNDENAPVLEVCLGGISIELLTPLTLALTGTTKGVLTVQDMDGFGEGLEVPANRSVQLPKGRIVRLGMISDSNTATIAVAGGIDLPLLYGSCATSPNAMIGGVGGRLLKDGDVLNLGEHWQDGDHGNSNDKTEDGVEDVIRPELTVDAKDFFAASGHIRVVLGPQDDHFTPAALAQLTTAEYKVTPALNRMGMRLEGASLEHIDTADILSDGIVTGSVQVPGNGQPIILLADHQTTGGYTKIATVITADLPKLARLRPGMTVHFKAVTIEDAEKAARAHEAAFQRVVAAIKSAAPLLDTTALYQLGDTT